ncbi:FAD-binding domain-containing protein [Patiriisocius marinus]|uniref:FAD-binding domain-containing protein n=1 Tax=Patiriisocius marinus TaxID=1397112 RepID=UPI00232C9141|nr:FAD-binding domain-containing protein [Patiriisocius marinus]
MKVPSTIKYIFPTELTEILKRIDAIDPEKYGRTRNFIDGAVTQLSPYISRGVISTKYIFEKLLDKKYAFETIEKISQELAWRDYWQLVWIEKGNLIDTDLKNEQTEVTNHKIAAAITDGTTGIDAIDLATNEFYNTGYLHNHIRMYIAAIACNMGRSHWKLPAQWMYYHLLDGDWASNALSWQWVAGTNSNKKYVANQENINKYCYTNQKNTWIDVPYEMFSEFETPQVLKEIKELELKTELPQSKNITINKTQPTTIYNYYNLDPLWLNDVKANRILLLEPSYFNAYPVSKKVLDFVISLSKNIPNIHLFVGEFDELLKYEGLNEIHFKEHPTSNHYQGTMHNRDWMTEVKGYYPSFFKFWNKAKKELKNRSIN